MNSQDTDRETEIYRRNYDTALSDLLSEIWGGHLHMGVFEASGDTLLEAQMRANQILAEAAGLKSGEKVLEVACGIGGTARYLAKIFGARVTATNIAETQLAEARALTKTEMSEQLISYQYADYHNLPFENSSFDAWWCQEALLYSIDKSKVLREALRVVKRGGRLILSDLTLDRCASAAAREEFAATIRAPGLWSSEQWHAMVDTLPVSTLTRLDWSSHVATTFMHVRNNLLKVHDEFEGRIGSDTVNGTCHRVTRQLEAAENGQLGCCAFVLTVN